MAIGMVAVLGVAAALIIPAIARSDWWNTSLHTAAPPPPLPLERVAGTVDVSWSTRGIAPGATPVAASTVFAASEHEVTGRDPRTGDVRWSYRRDNASLCAWTVQDDLVVVAFRHDRSGCTDLTALSAPTGERRWYRTVDLDAEISLTSTLGTVVAGSRTKLQGFSTVDGRDQWTQTKPDCQFGRPLAGLLGVAAIATCRSLGPQLMLHDTAGDTELWSIPIGGANPQVVAASDRVAVLSGERTSAILTLYDQGGALKGTVPLDGAVGRSVPPATVEAGLMYLWAGRSVVAVDLQRPALRWSAEASGPVALDARTTELSVVVPEFDHFSLRDPLTGDEREPVELTSGQVAGLRQIARVGDGVVTVGSAGTTVYR